jgi:hypothetical protein
VEGFHQSSTKAAAGRKLLQPTTDEERAQQAREAAKAQRFAEKHAVAEANMGAGSRGAGSEHVQPRQAFKALQDVQRAQAAASGVFESQGRCVQGGAAAQGSQEHAV